MRGDHFSSDVASSGTNIFIEIMPVVWYFLIITTNQILFYINKKTVEYCETSNSSLSGPDNRILLL